MICCDIESNVASLLHNYPQGQICVIADAHIKSPLALPTLYLAVHEENKSVETIARIWDFLFEQGITRKGLLICVGGGVLTDLGGFAASTYKRGIDYINIPTTLLAMVDASSGGKTGFNYHGIKNGIGTFHQPVQTLICPRWLKTLPAQEMLSGFVEMLKTGLLADEKSNLWYRLLQYDLQTLDTDALTPLIEQCIAVKERIVASDPQEKGLRKALNLGHTFGHALEEIGLDHHPFLHGYAVLYGLIAELYLSVVKLHCPSEPLQQLTQRMLQFYGRPECKCTDRKQLISLMQQDKKNERTAEINCTLIRSVGSPLINQIVTEQEAGEALDYLFSL